MSLTWAKFFFRTYVKSETERELNQQFKRSLRSWNVYSATFSPVAEVEGNIAFVIKQDLKQVAPHPGDAI